MRRVSLYVVCCSAALALVAAEALAQAPAAGAISGRVTQDGRPAAGVAVMLTPWDFTPRQSLLGRATTDEEGRYTLPGIAAGRYRVLAFAPASVLSDAGFTWPPGKPVTVSPGETVDGLDFTLARGGVITGRVTDAEGRPLINQAVHVTPTAPRAGPPMPMLFGRRMTDDRGVYRIFGLAPGSYRVSAGEDRERFLAYSGPQRLFRRTFHPNAAEEADAKIIEVTAGGEAADVDITMAATEKTYRMTGRVVEADTGRPAANVGVGVGPLVRGSQRLAGGYAIVRTDSRGEFQFETLTPGRYGVFVAPDTNDERYGDVVTFDVTDADVTGVEVSARRGGSIGGVVALEGAADRATAARLAETLVGAFNEGRDETGLPVTSRSPIGADGSFHVKGLRPGRVRFRLFSWPVQSGFTLLRVERGGVVEPSGGVELGAGEHVSGVRLVVAYATGVIRGRVKLEGDAPPPPDARLFVSARRVGAPAIGLQSGRESDVDSRGHFLLEGLPAGEYEVTVRLFQRGPRGGRPREAKQNVSVPATGEASVMLTLPPGEQEQ